MMPVSASYTPLCMELALTKKMSRRLIAFSSLAVYNAIIALRERFVNSFFDFWRIIHFKYRISEKQLLKNT